MNYFIHFEKCFFCDLIFKYGRSHYLGKFIPAYQITVCERCYNANKDGWDKEHQKKLIPYLKSKDLIIPEINKEGLIPRDPPLDSDKIKTITIKIDD
ncbi:TPA: hypothetical protein I8023_000838 [Legionella pneumophila]|nr:hypothetical protein [Legionella pneumophila]